MEELTRRLGKVFSSQFADTVDAQLGAGFQMWHLDSAVNVDFYGDLGQLEMEQLSAAVTRCLEDLEEDSSISISFFKSRKDAEDHMVNELKEWEANH